MKNVCLSGGAQGADTYWGDLAFEKGHEVIHFSFNGHKTSANYNTIYRLSEEELLVADPFLEKANLKLKRFLPKHKPHIINLLRRNYYQIAETYSVYAISTIKDGIVQGGTAWATQMYLDRKPYTVRCYVFDQDKNAWFMWNKENKNWHEILIPPCPTGIWTGIGTRDLNDLGKKAIQDVMNNTNNLYPIQKKLPNINDIIYIPSYENSTWGKRNGGWATVCAIQKVNNECHYLTTLEHTGYYQMNWENELAPVQKNLSDKFQTVRAHLGF